MRTIGKVRTFTTGYPILNYGKDSNTVVSLVTNYICTILYNRGHTGDKLYILKKCILSSHRYQKLILKDKMSNIFNDQYCQIDENFLENISLVNN